MKSDIAKEVFNSWFYSKPWYERLLWYIFHTGGGRYMDFSFHNKWHVTTHYYLFGFHVYTRKYTEVEK